MIKSSKKSGVPLVSLISNTVLSAVTNITFDITVNILLID